MSQKRRIAPTVEATTYCHCVRNLNTTRTAETGETRDEHKIETALRPFTVPDYVYAETAPRPRQEGLIEAPKYELSELPEQALADLCAEFRFAVFAKAGKEDPAR